MEPLRLVHVAILYVHPLLGEGLARLLGREPGVDAIAVSRDDPVEAALVLATEPDVVVVEQSRRTIPDGLLDRAYTPLLLFVSIDGPPCPGEQGATTEDPDVILGVIRRLQKLDRAPALAV
jgi:hypothetical protein